MGEERTGKGVCQNNSDLGWIDRVAHSSTEQTNSEEDHVSKKVEPESEPSLHNERDNQGTIFHVQTTVSSSDTLFLDQN